MIQVRGLQKRYGENEALKSVTFEIPPGQVCGYLGPNGAGKSTTVRILTGVMQATSGTAVVAGFDVAQQPLEVKKRIGYVPETGAAYQTLSVAEYLTLVGTLHHLPPEQIDQRAKRMLELLNIDNAMNQRIDTLSKGMRQKVVISAALLPDPEVLLFDEPLSGLDAHAAHTIKDIVRQLADHGRTVLYCSHLLDIVERLCDRVLILDHGEIVADGSPGELMESAKRGSLEHVFRQLTGGEERGDSATHFVESVRQPPRSSTDERRSSEPR